MNGVISVSIGDEVYYRWVEVLFKSILLHTNVEFALIYDNIDFFKKYNLDKIVKYPIYKTDIDNPYLFKYKLIEHSPFDNTIFFDADTIIFKDISPLFSNQFLSICGEWSDNWLYNYYSPFTPNVNKIVKKYNLKKLYSTYSGYIRFEKSDFYQNLFKEVISNYHFDNRIYDIYDRPYMPDEYFLNISISNLELEKFIPIKLYYTDCNDDIGKYYGFTFQNCIDIKIKNLDSFILNTLKKINISNYPLSIVKSKVNKEINVVGDDIIIDSKTKKYLI
jgi:hypothetical protein